MNEVDTPAVEVAEPETVEAPEAAPAPEVVAEVETEPTAEVVAEPQTSVDPNKLSALLDELGEIPDKPSEALLENIDERSIKNLPASVKGLFKHLVAAERHRVTQREAELEKRAAEIEKRFDEIKEQNRTVIRNRAQLNKVLLDPKFQEYLKAAEMPEEEMKDPLSPEGLEQRIKKEVAQRMKEFQQPITDSARKAQQLARYQDFVAENPEMLDTAFKTEVRDLMKIRRDSGTPVTLEDAHALVKGRRIQAEQEKNKVRDRLKRNESNRNISRTTVSSVKDSGDPVPKWVTEKGYNGVRGQSARIQYLRDNPAALKKLRAQQKLRR